MDELCFIAGCHDNHIGQASHVGDVEGTSVGGTIGPNQAPSVHGKAHCITQDRGVVRRQLLARNRMVFHAVSKTLLQCS